MCAFRNETGCALFYLLKQGQTVTIIQRILKEVNQDFSEIEDC